MLWGIGSRLLFLAIIALVMAAASDSGNPRSLSHRSELLERGESLLARGDVVDAIALFERAAAMMHAADAEMGLVRAYMQNGAYRRAAAFAAHAAGAHREAPEAAVLYAWLLHCGGQGQFAQRVLDQAEKRHPGAEILAQARIRLSSAAPLAGGALLQPPWRTAPYDRGESLATTAHVVASGVLIDKGRHALVPALSQNAIWLRDGLGRKSAAQVTRRLDALGLMLLRLAHPIEGASDLEAATTEPFAGSPGFVFQYAQAPGSEPAWPLLHAGFIGKDDAVSGQRRLAIELPTGAYGGPVLDADGRFLGVSAHLTEGQDRLILANALGRELVDLFDGAAARKNSQRAPAELIYEMALPVTLQVIVTP